METKNKQIANDTITSKEIDIKWEALKKTLVPAVSASNLLDLFQHQLTFNSMYNEWNLLMNTLIDTNEEEYVNYMKYLENNDKAELDSAIDVSYISYDSECNNVDIFMQKQKNAINKKKKLEFPFVSDEIIAWDSTSFIIRDTIYYSISGKRMVYFLKRLDIKE
jgi:hypothetical protein